MPRTPFISDAVQPPTEAMIAGYRATPISVREVMEDWLMIQSHAETIAAQRGQAKREGWPFDCSLEDNYMDLAWLQRCAEDRQLFCYILRRPSDNAYVACVYIYPIELHSIEHIDRYDVDLSYWLIPQEVEAGHYTELRVALLEWLKDTWKFDLDRVYVRNVDVEDHL